MVGLPPAEGPAGGVEEEYRSEGRRENSVVVKIFPPDAGSEELPLDVGLSEDPVVGVDHPGSQDAQEDDEGDELVESPEDIARDVRDALNMIQL